MRHVNYELHMFAMLLGKGANLRQAPPFWNHLDPPKKYLLIARHQFTCLQSDVLFLGSLILVAIALLASITAVLGKDNLAVCF
jgi:hypothetical protein